MYSFMEVDRILTFIGVNAMSLKVDVELKDGATCQMANKAFNIFLALGKVAKFKRSDGWIIVGKGPLRDLDKTNDYPLFADRRTAF
jgi:hypothetical protein